MSRRRGTTLAGLACLALLSACTDDPGAGGADSWPTTDQPVDADGLVWASGSEVHLPDGTTIDTGDLAGAYVVAGPGVWFASAEPGELEQNRLPELRLATPDGVQDTGVHPGIGSLTTSADGRWLAFIDRLEEGAGSAEAVVVDLSTGEEVVRSDEGLVPDDTDDADWTDLYEDAPVSVLGVVDDTAYVRGLGDVIAHDLSTGEVETIDLSGTELVEQEWFRTLNPEPPLWNADRSWNILEPGFAQPVSELESAEGEQVTTSVPDGAADEWMVGGWVDADTAVAITPTQDGADVSWTSPALMACEVPTGECTVLEGTEGGVNLPVDRPFGVPRERSLEPG
jgi:hypothetical protein